MRWFKDVMKLKYILGILTWLGFLWWFLPYAKREWDIERRNSFDTSGRMWIEFGIAWAIVTSAVVIWSIFV